MNIFNWVNWKRGAIARVAAKDKLQAEFDI